MSTPADESIKLRIDMLNGHFDLTAPTTDFMNIVRQEIERTARTLNETRPADVDIGRFIAAIDHLQQAKNLFCDSVILGEEAQTRRKKRAISNE